MTECPCGFAGPATVRRFSRPWHEAHERAHLAAFPEVDDRTREILRDACKESLDTSGEVEA